ncbi:MAG TPA: GNAT family N-acetyltransferase [Blastocatellia bacterium]|nr:GNAT family N-acetyltransferase [Blastocatellia bacterium]
MLRIIDLTPGNEVAIQQTAQLLFDAFQEHWPQAWPTPADALEEVHESFSAERVSRIAIDDGGNVRGWIGGSPQYDGRVWELHPLAVQDAVRGQGVGRALVNDLEGIVKARGGLTLWLGTDDEDQQTSLAGVNLYPNVWEYIATIKNLRGHPYEFYQKLGFVIIGVLPDANGLGKPDIFMAKRIT